MYPDTRSFVQALESQGELVRIGTEVSPVLEIAEITDRVSKSPAARQPSASARRTDPEFVGLGGSALLFERVAGSDFPVLINGFGSYRRMEIALGRTFQDVADQIGEVVKPEPPRSLGEAVAKAVRLAPLLRVGPKRLRRPGACQEVVKTGAAIDCTRLGLIRCWPGDADLGALGYPPDVNAGVDGLGHPALDPDAWDDAHRGRYITLAGVHTIHPDDRHDPRPKSHNIGMYRVQLLGRDRLAMHWHMHHDGAGHWRSWKKLGEPMPVAIVLGGPSVLPYAATCPLPPGISELLMAGFLNRRGIRLCRAKTVPLWVPADADIVIEGFVRTDAGFPGFDPRAAPAAELGPGAVFEGPFGDHTGFYSLPDRYPVTEVTAITHRRDAVYPTTIVGLPPQEDYYLGKATERIMLPLLRTLIPDIDDYHLPMFGAFHNCAAIRIDKHYPLHARRVMHAVWGAGQMAWTKSVFVVGTDVDVHDASAVLRAACRFCRPSRDLETVRGALDILDHAAPRLAAGTKIGFDCTPKIPGEEANATPVDPGREPPSPDERAADVARARTLPGVVAAAAPAAAPGWLFIAVDRDLDEPDRAGLGRRAIHALFDRPTACPFVVVVGRGVDVHDHHQALFHWLANMDPGRDMILDQAHTCDRVAFDATPKTAADATPGEPVRQWPPVLRMDQATRDHVTARWADYGLGLGDEEIERQGD